MTSTKLKYADKLNVIRQFRKTGDVSKTSKQTGYSRSYVSEVFSGIYRNEDIVNYGFKVTNPRKRASIR